VYYYTISVSQDSFRATSNHDQQTYLRCYSQRQNRPSNFDADEDPDLQCLLLLRWLFNPKIFTTRNIKAAAITRKAVIARKYLRQGKTIRQVASPSSLCQRFPYALFNAMVTKISKWSRIQDFCRVMPRIESLVVYAMPAIPSKFQKDPSITFWVILLTHRQTDRQTNKNRQKHYLLGGGKNKANKNRQPQPAYLFAVALHKVQISVRREGEVFHVFQDAIHRTAGVFIQRRGSGRVDERSTQWRSAGNRDDVTVPGQFQYETVVKDM